MVPLVNAINVVLTPVFDVICWPFRTLAPMWALTAISLASGVLLVWLFGKTSDQTRIRAIRGDRDHDHDQMRVPEPEDEG